MCMDRCKESSNNQTQDDLRTSDSSSDNGGLGCGSLSIIGIGPGSPEYLVPAAKQSIEEAEIIIGYKTYIRLIRPICEKQQIIESGMRNEVERARLAIANAAAGRNVCVISSGDPGVYGMAGLVLELLTPQQQGALRVGVIPGVTAANACAALLGAPLVHDFAVISLSDLMTDSLLIEKRLLMAAQADFVTVLYNPKSATRTELIRKAQEIFLAHRKPDTPVGIVKNAYRDAQEVSITVLMQMLKFEIDMRTTIIIGNSHTSRRGSFMVTPRGYQT